MKRRLNIVLGIVALLIGCHSTVDSGLDSEESVFFLVRHAEKVDESDGSPLTEQGQRRAEKLAEMLRDSGVQTMYSSDYERTRLTAAPLARELHLEVEIYDHRSLDAFSKQLLSRPGRYLVVGHSNTTPQLAALLGGEPGPDIQTMEYDRIYLLVHRPGAETTTVVLRFEP